MSDELQDGRKLNLDKYPRIGGVLFLVLGLIFGFIGFYFPIHDAYQHAPKLVTYPKATFFSVALTILGCVLLILGPLATRLVYKYAALRGWKLKLLIVALVLPLVLAAILVDHVFEQFLESLGYKF
ncbi:MAG: hypothetical protein ABSH17_04805 [Syntrophobacteraceae bacterium]|jgi:uncharacterized membrane protein